LGNNNQRGRLTTRAIRGVVMDAYKLAGIVGERKTTHSLRHTAISNILRNGGTLQQAQAVARHSNIATTGIYVHEMERITNAGERLINYGR
jgi:integrase/recombinase XerC